MKKLIYCLGALLLCLMMTSCGDPLEKLDSLIDQVKTEGKNMTVDEWESFYRDLAQAHLDFWNSEPTKADIKKYNKLGDRFSDAIKKVSEKEKAQKNMEKAQKRLKKDDEFQDFGKQIKKAEKKAKKKASKSEKDDDEEEDEDDEDDDD